ncbi:hypothetical protein X986_1100 [Burkholderia pseudomallei]|nr:hypothetical protein X984_1073 [Burkholderia pseudomallei]KGX28410.1 hypothetical protein X986_1100 [Burkholderia pseudomallei]
MRLSQPFVRWAGERGERRSAAASAAGSGRRGARGEAPGPGRAAERAGRQRAGAPAWAGKSGRTRGATGGDGRSLDRAARAAGRSERAGAAGASGAERVKRAGIAERPRSGGDEAAATRPNGRRAAPDWTESQRDGPPQRTTLHAPARCGRERAGAERSETNKRPQASAGRVTRARDAQRPRQAAKAPPAGRRECRKKPARRASRGESRAAAEVDRRSATDDRRSVTDSRRPTTDSG